MKSRSETEKVVGRFRVKFGSSPDRGTLPAHWIGVELESADGRVKPVFHAIRLSGAYTVDELFTESKYKEVNKLVKAHLGSIRAEQEVVTQIRTLNNLADLAGYSTAATLAAVQGAIEEARRNGLEPAFGISAASQSMAFLAASNKQALQSWRSGATLPDKGGPVSAKKEDEERAVVAIQKLGGTVHRDEKLPGNPVSSVSLRKTPATDADLAHLASLHQIRGLDLADTAITGPGLQRLQNLSRLTYLSVFGSDVTDSGLEAVKVLTQVEDLNLGGTKITDAGLKHLRGLTKLRSLALGGTRITDAGLDNLAPLTNLKHVNLFGTKVSDRGIEKLKTALTGVKILSFTEEERKRRKEILEKPGQSQSRLVPTGPFRELVGPVCSEPFRRQVAPTPVILSFVPRRRLDG